MTADVIDPSVQLKLAARKRVTDTLWHRGELGWKLEAHQRTVYDRVREAMRTPNSRFVLNASRRWGKTYLLCAIVIEFALMHPGACILYCGSSQKSVKEFILPAFHDIMADCPESLRPKVKTQTNQIVFSNGAWIKITGLDGGRLQKLRGLTASLIIVDEAGFIDNLEQAVTSVLFPMTSSTGGAMLLSSNAPLTPNHDFVSVFTREAEEAGLYCKQTIEDVPKYSRADIDRFAAAVGGYESATFQREYLCRFVADELNAVVPEWNRFERVVVQDPGPRPEFFYPMVSGDIGLVDFTGVLFGYYDFPRARAVVEDELLFRHTDSKKLVEACIAKEKELWDSPLKRPSRIFDGQSFTINDIVSIQRYVIAKPDDRGPGTLEAEVNAVRQDCTNGKLIIHPRCKLLAGQCQDATWNLGRTEFKRDKKNGHFDLLAALQGFVKYINRTSNPFPMQADWRTTMIKNSRLINPSYNKLKKLLAPRG